MWVCGDPQIWKRSRQPDALQREKPGAAGGVGRAEWPFFVRFSLNHETSPGSESGRVIKLLRGPPSQLTSLRPPAVFWGVQMGQGLSPLVLRPGHLFPLSCAAGVMLFWTLQTLTVFFMGLWRELTICSGRQPVQRGSLCVNPTSPPWTGRRALCSSSSGPHTCAPLARVCPL